MKTLAAWALLLLLPNISFATDWIHTAYQSSTQLETAGKYPEAINALKPVLDLYPNGYAANMRLGWLNYLAVRHENSLHHYQKASQIAPAAFEPRTAMLLPMLALQQWQAAEQTAYQVLKDDPLNYYANVRLISALIGSKKNELAKRQAHKLLERYPLDIPALSSLAVIYRSENRHDLSLQIQTNIDILQAGYQGL